MGRIVTGRQDVNETAIIPACAQCGDPIAPPRKRYCSDKCKNRAWEDQHRPPRASGAVNERASGAVNAQCRGCGTPLEGASYRPRVWCSSACRMRTIRSRAVPDGEWIPEPGDKTSRAAVQRRHLIGQYAAQGFSSDQISERIGITPETIRRIARETGTEIPADSILTRTHRLDSSRIVAETASALEGLAIGVGLVSLGDLDPAQAQHWAASLTASIRDLDRFVKTMKENAQ